MTAPTREEAEAAFVRAADPLDEDRPAVLIGRQIVDEETGEILDWPAEADTGPERIALLIHYHREADREIKAWEVEKQKWARLLARALAEAGMRSLGTQYGKATLVAATTTRSAPAVNVARAAAEELMTVDEAAALLTRAAKELDVDEVEAWIGERPEDERKLLRLMLINFNPRRGYTRTSDPAKPSPRREKAGS